MASGDEQQAKNEPDRVADPKPIVTKVSGSGLDRAIERLSQTTAPYFRPGGPLMPGKR